MSFPEQRRMPVSTALAVLALVASMALAGCEPNKPFNTMDISGSLPELTFSMTRADDGKTVTEASYRNTVTLLYFGYTHCPDVCPMTLANVAQILKKLGDDAAKVRILFVTVDPDRDDLATLKTYVDAFAPQIDGLRGSSEELAQLAKRYRISYSVRPSSDPEKYVVTHSASVYVFDKAGKARLLATSLHTNDPDIAGLTADLKRLVDEKPADEGSSLLSWL